MVMLICTALRFFFLACSHRSFLSKALGKVEQWFDMARKLRVGNFQQFSEKCSIIIITNLFLRKFLCLYRYIFSYTHQQSFISRWNLLKIMQSSFEKPHAPSSAGRLKFRPVSVDKAFKRAFGSDHLPKNGTPREPKSKFWARFSPKGRPKVDGDGVDIIHQLHSRWMLALNLQNGQAAAR